VTSKTIKLAGSFVLAMLVSVILLWVLIFLWDSLAWMFLALGLAAGWATGILLAPYQSEQDRFKEYLKIVSSFLAGYAVSKIDRLFELWLDPARGAMALTSIFAHRALVCVTAFLLAAVSTYVGRKYVSFGPGAEQTRRQ
jgi:hypothetical protein